MNAIFDNINKLINANRPFVLCTIIATEGSTPRKTGTKMIVLEDASIIGTIGGGNLEHVVIKRALAALNEKKPQIAKFNLKEELNMECGGGITLFIEPFFSTLKLYIFGAGHIGQQLFPLGKKIGFSVTIIDNRSELLLPEAYPEDIKLLNMEPVEALPLLSFDSSTYVVIITHKHIHDFDILRQVIHKPLAYVGMIGSSRKVGQALMKLQEEGITNENLKKLYAPIGFGIKADTPEEIAILIAAELVKIKKEYEKQQNF